MATWRLAHPDEDEALVAMFVALNREDPGQSEVPPEHMSRTLQALRDRPDRGRVLALDDAGALRGYALLIGFWSNELGGECCTLDELYVDPRARGHGHGGALIEALAAGSPLWPYETRAILLEVSPENTRALALYRRHGFRGANLCLRLPRRAPRSNAGDDVT